MGENGEKYMFTKKFQKHYLTMMLPGCVWLLLFTIIPMFGIVMAFQEFHPVLGLFKSPWIGLENFSYIFELRDVRQVFFNTVRIATGKMIGNLVFPLVFALLLNELKLKT